MITMSTTTPANRKSRWRPGDRPPPNQIRERLREIAAFSDAVRCALNRSVFQAYVGGLPDTEIAKSVDLDVTDVRLIIAEYETDPHLVKQDSGWKWIPLGNPAEHTRDQGP